MPGGPGQERGTSVSWCRCQPEHLLLQCTERSRGFFPNLPSTRRRKFWIAKDRILTFGLKSSKEHIRPAGPCRRSPCDGSRAACLILGHAPLSSESLKAVFQSPSPSTRCPERRRHFITSDIFLTNLEKAYLIIFFSNNALLSMFILA